MALIYVLFVLVGCVFVAGWYAIPALLALFGGIVALNAIFGPKKKPGQPGD